MLSDEQLLRYSRQILLPDIDINGQQKLLDAHVAILGLGGLGSPVALYLAAAGVGQITLIDDDKVELSNLQRQIIHSNAAIGDSKVISAQTTLKKHSPHCEVNLINKRLDEAELKSLTNKVDIFVDCSDNFASRFMLNRVCFATKTPLVSGAAIRWEGQLTSFTMQTNTPCYRCLYEEDSFNDQSCSNNGVVAPLVGAVGSVQALEAIKLITGKGQALIGRLLLFDALAMEWRQIQYKRRPDCPVCS